MPLNKTHLINILFKQNIELVLKKKLGEGAYGTVNQYCGISPHDKICIAVKHLETEDEDEEDEIIIIKYLQDKNCKVVKNKLLKELKNQVELSSA